MLKSFLSILFLLTLLVSTHAVANQSQNDGCKNESQKNCTETDFSIGNFKKCMKDKSAKLSEACKGKGKQLRAKGFEAMQACKADSEKLCGDAQGIHKMKKCLMEHKDKLSSSCKAQLNDRSRFN